MLIPDEALPFIAMHRTHLRGDLKALYAADVARDFTMLRPHLPKQATAVLDIGCGMAGIDLLLWRYYGNPTVHLLDGTGFTDVRILFHPKMDPYNSMPIARRLLEGNGVPGDRIVEWAPDPAAAVPSCDLVLSLLSWGFHYPVSTYLRLAERVLKPDGRLILDVRKGQGGLETVATSFSTVAIIDSSVKADRVCFIKRGQPFGRHAIAQ
jgi:SAM-dependent methyltransferase